MIIISLDIFNLPWKVFKYSLFSVKLYNRHHLYLSDWIKNIYSQVKSRDMDHFELMRGFIIMSEYNSDDVNCLMRLY